MINRLINELVQYGISKHLVEEDDLVYVTNRLLELFGQIEFSEEITEERPLAEILEDMCTYAFENEMIEDDSVTVTDLFDTKIMGLLTPAPSVVRKTFYELYKTNSKLATDYYYEFSKRTNYIRIDRIAKDEKWVTETPYGPIDITINLSKPEKDPRDIAKAGQAKKSGYPSCLLCMENEGYAGHISHPARQNHRIIPIKLDGQDYFLQYSPYVYYNEHCIIFNKEHTPMKIDKAVFKKILEFVGKDIDQMTQAADHILTLWKSYTDEAAFIFSETDGTLHNTITPIARMHGGLYELDLVLRNNITTDECPWGVYHPSADLHHIKKENIGLIEVMGLAVLPARLKKEMLLLEEYILTKRDIRSNEEIEKHADWVDEWINNYEICRDNIHSILQDEISKVFVKVLECAGVYKRTEEGQKAFDRFVDIL